MSHPDGPDPSPVHLSDSQRAAAQDPAREVLGLACAGSGKSRTLAFRIAYQVAGGAPANSIVAFTFTEKAAETIKRRIADALIALEQDPAILGAMYVGTIHAFCQKLLAETDARYRQYDVLDSNRLVLYLISRYPELGIVNVRNDRARPGLFKTIGYVGDAWATLNNQFVDIDNVGALDAELGDVLHSLAQSLERDQFVDFSLMVRRAVEALRDGRADGSETINNLQHLLVDEYQDINPAEEALITELYGRGATLTVFGDDDQAIYGWRGSDVQNILTFEQRFAAARHPLIHNYRSTCAIVAAADQFAAAELGATRFTKNPTANNPRGVRDFRRLWFPNRPNEAEWVAERIDALLGCEYHEDNGAVRGLTPADFAILMRSTASNEQNDEPRHTAFTRALQARGIHFSLEAGGGPFERQEVAVLRDAFELLRNGQPAREEVQALFDTAIQPVYPAADFTHLTQVLAEWGTQIHAPRDETRRRVYPQQLVHDLLYAFGIQDTEFDPEVMRAMGLFSRMLQDVEAVYVSVDSPRRFTEILNFLQNTAKTGYDTSTDDLVMRPDAVSVMTVHKAKGLEFPVVFVVDVEQGRFPVKRSDYDGWLPPQVIQNALGRGAYQTSNASEARLFYTSITRAARFLYVTGCANLPGGRRPRKPSQFALRLEHAELHTTPELPVGIKQIERRRKLEESDLPTTFSEIRYYLRCPRDYQFRKRYGFSPPIPELFGFGQTVHAAVGRLHQVFNDTPPLGEDAEELARNTFHLKHVAQSRDPVDRPGPYERAQDAAGKVVRQYAESYQQDFAQERQVEAHFEVAIRQAVISGSIDLLLREDENGNILEARVIDFKSVEGGEIPENNDAVDWTELALQVQLYAKGAREVLGENARTGAVHFLKDNQRIDVPVDDAAVEAAIANVEWAVERVLAGDFPMRPHPAKCEECDFRMLCPQRFEEIGTEGVPPELHVPNGRTLARAFSQVSPEHQRADR